MEILNSQCRVAAKLQTHLVISSG